MNKAKKQLLAYIDEAMGSKLFTDTAHYILMDVIDGCNESAELHDRQIQFVTEHTNAIANSIMSLKANEKAYRAKMASIVLASYVNSCG